MADDRQRIYDLLIQDRNYIYDRIEYLSREMEKSRSELRYVVNAIYEMENQYGLKEDKFDD